ncbi:hypothetical protein BGZ80_003065 [Entomortierella chlamydospora]|uniref:Uncharacterized protein n=1 Tax=Entomortierella chlamydospora TaxID=101097 RepID=A0A9P6T2Z6_9FUNG|nr:hypothetical protein BGZ80_003065 [Entomortierella chlamydospora]
MHASATPPRDIVSNPEVEEYLRKEGMTEDEWKRVYDLRYCTILVPFEDVSDEEDAELDHENDEKDSSNSPEEPLHNHGISTPPKSQGQRQLPTPKSIQRHQDSPHAVLPKRELHTPTRNIGLRTPIEKKSTDAPKQPRAQIHNAKIRNNQEDDLAEEDTDALTINDPLASYLPAARTNAPKLNNVLGHSSDLTMDVGEDDDMEYFHDALDSHYDSDQAEDNGSSRAGLKRRHWELEQTHRLLQPTQPTAMKRVALSTSFLNTTSTETLGLLRPRSFSPSPSSIISQRRGSMTSDTSSVSHLSFNQNFSQRKLWTTQDWKTLEATYNQMNGNAMKEADLTQVADRFLEEQEAQTGEKSFWSREKVHMRCIALYRVRSDTRWDPVNHGSRRSRLESTPLSAGLRGASRRSAQPYPAQNLSKSKSNPTAIPSTGADRTSSSAIADFLSHRRADRSQKQKNADQGYQLKSVFKHRLASGLRTVGQLIPFWKDVEQGNTNIKGKQKVPLGVPLGTAQAVIDSFESKSLESECSGSSFSRSGSVLSNSDSNCERSRSSPSTPSPASSIAEMLARGHSVRSTSATSESSLA